jgi:hypothetical protein
MAWNQIEVLKRFQLENWPWRIQDPLGKGWGAKHASRLKVTVHRIEERQIAHLIRLHCRALEGAVTWEWAYEKFC